MNQNIQTTTKEAAAFAAAMQKILSNSPRPKPEQVTGNQPLMEAWDQLVANQTPDFLKIFYQQLRQALLLIPVKLNQTDSTISLVLYPKDNNEYFQVFTSWEELEKDQTDTERHILAATFNECAELALALGDINLADGLIINPGGRHMTIDLGGLAELMAPAAKAKQMDVDYSQLKISGIQNPPEGLKKALSDFCAKYSKIKKAYWALMEQPDGSKSLLIALKIKGGGEEELFNEAGRLLEPFTQPDMPIDMTLADNHLGRLIAEKSRQIYTRKMFGWF